MQWKQIKTLFILCFLVLNIYLLFIFFDKQKDSDYGFAGSDNMSIEDQLKAEDITISADLSDKQLEESYISAGQKVYSKEKEKMLKDMDNQKSIIINSKMIVSKFKEPVPIPDNAKDKQLAEMVKSRIIFPEKYIFNSWNKEMNVLVFFQTISDRPVYYNKNGMLLVFLNDDNEMIFYAQTTLGEAKSQEEVKTLIKQKTAIHSLFKKNLLQSGDEVTKVNMGFHTRIPMSTDEQVFAPTWIVTVNDKKNYFVNAIENLVVSSDELTFLIDAVESIIDKIRPLDDHDDLKQFILEHLNQTLMNANRSEVE